MADWTLHLTSEVSWVHRPTQSDLEAWYLINPGWRKNTYQKICNLGEVLESGIDPMEFLTRMYEKWGSLDVIMASTEVQEIGKENFVSRATLHRILFEHLEWKPRANTDRTPVHEQRLKEKIEWEIREFEDKVQWLLHGREVKREFDIEEFRWKRYRIGKALYILKTIGGIDKNILFKLSKEGGFSDAIIANSLNKQLRDIIIYSDTLQEYGIRYEDVEVYPQSINRWFKWNKDKEETSNNE